MRTTLYSDLIDEALLAEVPGVPMPVAINALRNSAIEFCDRTRVWTTAHDPLDIVANEPVYQFEPPSWAVVAGVKQAWHNGVELSPTTQFDLFNEYRDWKTLTGTPLRYLQENSEEIILFPIPTAALVGGLTMKVWLKPSRASTGMEDWMVEKYQEAIAHGAMGRLYGMPGKPWSNAELAVYHRSQFDDALAAAAIAAAKGLGLARLRTTPRFF